MLKIGRGASRHPFNQLSGLSARLFASESPIFTAEAISSGGRDGQVKTADGALQHRLAVPKQLGGKAEPGATNPEQMLAAGFSACFLSALGVAAQQSGKSLSSDATVQGLVSIYGEKAKYYLGTQLKIQIPGVQKAEIDELIEAADKICPFSNAVRGNIDVQYTSVEGLDSSSSQERSNL